MKVPMRRSSRLIKTVIMIIKLAVVAGLLWYLVASGRLKWEYLRVPAENWRYVVLGIVMSLGMFFLGFVRFKLLLYGAGVRISTLFAFQVGSIGLLFMCFALGLLTGDAARLAYVIRETRKRAGAVAGLMVDRFLGLLGLLFVGGMVLVLNRQMVLETPELHNLGLGVAVLFLGFSCAGFILLLAAPVFSPDGKTAGFIKRLPLGGKLMSLITSLLRFRGHFGILLAGFAVSVCIHLLLLGALYMFSQSVILEPSPTAGQVFFAGAPAYVSGVLPLPVGALGVGETIFDYLLGRCTVEGIPVRGGAGVFLLTRSWRLTLVLLLGVPFYLAGQTSKPKGGNVSLER